MRHKKLDFDRAILIDRPHWDVPLLVHLHPYLRFSRQVDRQLRNLVARWAHAAAPRALGRRPRKN